MKKVGWGMGLFFGLLMVGQPENGDWGFQAAFSLWSFKRHWRPSEKLKRQTVNQTTACVRTAHTLHVGFEVSRDSQVGCVAQPRTRSVRYAGYGLLPDGVGEHSCYGCWIIMR